MKIRDVMTTPVVSVTPDTYYADAARLMHEHALASLVVLDKMGSLVGILSEKDLFRALYPKYREFYRTPHAVFDEEQYEATVEDLREKPVRTFMTTEILSIGPDEPIMKAGGLMLAHHIHLLPVLDDEKFLGVVSRENVFGAVLKSHLGF